MKDWSENVNSSTVEMLVFHNEGAHKNNKGEDLHPSSSKKKKVKKIGNELLIFAAT